MSLKSQFIPSRKTIRVYNLKTLGFGPNPSKLKMGQNNK